MSALPAVPQAVTSVRELESAAVNLSQIEDTGFVQARAVL